MKTVHIDNRAIGQDESPYFIAEIGNNHNGDMRLCREMIDAAKSCGADCVKFQSWAASTLFSEEEYKKPGNKSNRLSFEQAKRYQLTPEMHYEVAKYCKKKDITFLSSVFSRQEIDLLEELESPAFKISSGELINHPLLEYVGKKKKPVILSTGMATLAEIEAAVKLLKKNGTEGLVLLHCVSIYPPQHKDINLRNIETLRTAFDCPVGFSDHSLGTTAPLAAIALGACIIEKHFTTDKKLEGWDHAISADPAEMKQLIDQGQSVFEALGSTVRKITQQEKSMRVRLSRSLILKQAREKGDLLTAENIDFKRPGTGIRPDEVSYVLGRRLAKDIAANEIINWQDLE